MKLNEFIKRRGVYLFSLFLLSVLYALIIPNTIFAVFCFLLSFSLSFYSLYTYEKKVFSFEKEISSYSFFSSFLNSLMAQIPTKQSYEFALQYLLSYQEEVPYESIKENPSLLTLYSFQPYFERIIEKDKKEEAHLSDYVPLINRLEEKKSAYQKMRRHNEKSLSLFLLVLLCFFLLILALFLINSSLKELTKNTIYCVFSFLILPFIYPSSIFFTIRKTMKGAKA